jgi:hypothetical protein
MLAQESYCVQVDLPPQHPTEFLLHSKKTEARNMVRFEFDQYIDVAILTEIVAKDGAKQGKQSDVISFTRPRTESKKPTLAGRLLA